MFAFSLLFALLWINRGYVYALGKRFERYDPPAVLDLPRAGGIRVTAKDAGVYGPLIRLVEEKSGGRPIYAGPNCEQVYFLSGLPDAVPYGPGSPRNPMERAKEIYRGLEEKGSRVVVLNRIPQFTGNLRPRVVARFEDFFPHSRVIGHFVVRWKD